MDLNDDKEADAMYIEFQKAEFAKNKKVDDFAIIDRDAKGNILGIELLEMSKRIPPESLPEAHVRNVNFD